jgi:hypothetical protein
MGHFVMGHFVMGHFVMGHFVMGHFAMEALRDDQSVAANPARGVRGAYVPSGDWAGEDAGG